MKYLLFPFLSLLLLISCDSNDDSEFNPENAVVYKYAETQCADPWESYGGSTESEVQDALGQYLDHLNIVHFSIAVLENPDPFIITCGGCNCPSSRTIVLEGRIEDKDALTDLNFILQ